MVPMGTGELRRLQCADCGHVEQVKDADDIAKGYTLTEFYHKVPADFSIAESMGDLSLYDTFVDAMRQRIQSQLGSADQWLIGKTFEELLGIRLPVRLYLGRNVLGKQVEFRPIEDLGTSFFGRTMVVERERQEYFVKAFTTRESVQLFHREGWVLQNVSFSGAFANLEAVTMLPSEIDPRDPGFASQLNEPLILVEEYFDFETAEKVTSAPQRNSGFFNTSDAIFVSWQLLQAVKVLHSCGFVHRDLKPENVMIGAREDTPSRFLKLIDLEGARDVQTMQMQCSNCQTYYAVGRSSCPQCQVAAHNICLNCEAHNPMGDRRCIRCGSTLLDLRKATYTYSQGWEAPEQRDPSDYQSANDKTDVFAAGELIAYFFEGRERDSNDPFDTGVRTELEGTKMPFAQVSEIIKKMTEADQDDRLSSWEAQNELNVVFQKYLKELLENRTPFSGAMLVSNDTQVHNKMFTLALSSQYPRICFLVKLPNSGGDFAFMIHLCYAHGAATVAITDLHLNFPHLYDPRQLRSTERTMIVPGDTKHLATFEDATSTHPKTVYVPHWGVQFRIGRVTMNNGQDAIRMEMAQDDPKYYYGTNQ